MVLNHTEGDFSQKFVSPEQLDVFLKSADDLEEKEKREKAQKQQN